MQANSRLITQSPSSPSFNSYSSGKLAEIAARVVQEFSNDHSQDHDNIFSWQQEYEENKNHKEKDEAQEQGQEDEDEFEFAIVCREPVESPISADDIFYNGQIRPIYPLFNTKLLLDKEDQESSKSKNTTTATTTTTKPNRLPLRKLFSEERESSTTTSSCSSSEADELENVPAESYCVWTPKKDVCKKSSSTGSSKRWKFRDLLYNRSNSDGINGNDAFVLFKNSERRLENANKQGKGIHAVEKNYVKTKSVVKEGDKRQSFLPYRQDLVGLFSNVNGLSRNLHPF
ncbi:uncharacterized protein LOC8289005 [Ricinus communis]|uniref:Uncharacterized protein n=1 Tax=Ricinus communis TaxID=3988 RepID=B9RB23_RICCO|nr:uncharacterized protein LOC8289005 [Ricinus communis]EEF52000.1 conserved hypothetical protein [Ricinus communis]|eukprot:XP_002511398.1 uncharacterized protein LOC8289005 [Ricinus communis]